MKGGSIRYLLSQDASIIYRNGYLHVVLGLPRPGEIPGVTAVAMIKVIGLFITGVTMGTLFLPERLKWLLYVFPNYWSAEGFNRLFIQTDR